MNALSHPARSAGFTLVEIMVVIVILGLLATLVVQNVVRTADEAKVTKAKADVVSIEGAAKLFFVQRGRLPKLTDLAERDGGKPPYIDALPQDPWHRDYELREGAGRGEFEIVSAGPDGELGSADDIRSGAAR